VALLATFRLLPLLALRADEHVRSLPPPIAAPLAFLLGNVVSVNPEAGGVPGSGAVQTIANGIAWWALVLSLLGLVIGAASWAIGSHSSNYQYATAGRRAVIVSGLAALLIGAAPTVINFFFTTGQQVHR
jgi:hypothetical protein